MKKTTIGIDLGTTNSCVSIMENGVYKILPNEEGHNTTPSVVGFASNGEKLVGQIAKRQSITNPTKTIFGAKRLIGRKFNDPDVQKFIKIAPFKIIESKNGDAWVEVDGKAISPEEISSYVLQKMKKAAENYLGYEVSDVVLSVPAYFNDAQKTSTRNSGRIAGLNVKRIINEPTAAALAYGFENKKNKIILIADIGGGTADTTILEISSDGVFEVKSTNGDTFLGGEDFDYKIINWMVEEFKKTSGIDLKQDNMALQRLKEAAEKAKHELSNIAQTDINLPFITADSSGPKHLNLTLTRSKFENLIEDLLQRLINPLKTCIKDSGHSVEELDEVILVGGSTRIPIIQKMIKDICKKEPNKSVNPDEIVAAGAAVQGGVMSGDVKDVLLLDVTPLSLGIETMGGVFTKIIEKNTTIPTKKSQVFSTAVDNQPAVSISISQGEREFAKDNKNLGNFDLTGINPAPRGVPQIEVTFDIDANGIVHVSALDKATGKSQEIKITGGSGLSEEEIKKMMNEAEENKSADQARRKLVDSRNQLDSMIFSTEKMVKDFAGKLESSDVDKINQALVKAKEKINNESLEQIESAIKDLEKVAHELSSKMYNNQASQENDKDKSNGKKPDESIDAEYKQV